MAAGDLGVGRNPRRRDLVHRAPSSVERLFEGRLDFGVQARPVSLEREQAVAEALHGVRAKEGDGKEDDWGPVQY